MKFFWISLKCAGMLFVILNCILLAARMNELGSATGNFTWLVLVLILDTAFICWAYEVIWKQIPKR